MTLDFLSCQESVNKTLLDMKKNDGHFMELVPLCQTVVVQQAEKLSNIEEYISKYGYVAPDVQSSRLVNASKDDSAAGNDVDLQRCDIVLPLFVFHYFSEILYLVLDVNENKSDDVQQCSEEFQCQENVKDKTRSLVEYRQESSVV